MVHEQNERDSDPKFYTNRPMMTMPAIFEKSSSDFNSTKRSKNLSVIGHAKTKVVHFEKKKRTLSSMIKQSTSPNFNVYLEEQISLKNKPIPAGPGKLCIS